MRTGRQASGVALAGLLFAATAQAEAISGVCPDGSMFIVQRSDAIPCRNAKVVEPDDMPPLNPEFLPRPYGWEVFNRESDPNNPYNVVDSVRPEGDARALPSPPPRTAAPPPVGAPPPSTPRTGGTSPAPRAELSFALAPQEIDDLAAIIQVLQQDAPATLVQQGSAGPGLQVSLARSAAFEARVREVLAGRGTPVTGAVIAFSVTASEPAAFWGNLTFVQGHIAHHPDAQDPAQLGLVEGAFGELAAGDRVQGYAVLPDQTDPSQPIDVYWNDRQLTATFSP